ncbi:ABC transporter transmembrane domain-containing protein [Pontitalea aquivivens]|uniref:ABC transporter transmembrane domain-containing protein n=1 Tax=Pontitalea aquivivens TaxID=3388663 RepID=UPI003970877A
MQAIKAATDTAPPLFRTGRKPVTDPLILPAEARVPRPDDPPAAPAAGAGDAAGAGAGRARGNGADKPATGQQAGGIRAAGVTGAGGGTGAGGAGAGAGGGSGQASFHRRLGPVDYTRTLGDTRRRIRANMLFVGLMTCATNVLILSIPIYLFQISDRVLTSRSTDTLVMLTLVITGAIVVQAVLDAVRRFVLMRTATDVAARLGAPILSAAAQAALHSNGREYQTLGDLNQLRSFLVSGTLLSFLDVPFAPLFILAIFLIHPHLGMIVVTTAAALAVFAYINQRLTSDGFRRATAHQSRANLHLDSMARNSQIINAMAMIPEAVTIWGRDTAASLKAQVEAQDRNILTASASRMVRLLTQVAMLGWGGVAGAGRADHRGDGDCRLDHRGAGACADRRIDRGLEQFPAVARGL